MRKLLLAFLLLSGVARAESVVIPLADGTELKAELFVPSGQVVGPAIVALHGCGGAYPARDRFWREALVGSGHVMLFPDSFGSRGLKSQCREQDRVASSFQVRRTDAVASAAWLAARAGVPAGGVVLMGWSDGGSTVVAAAKDRPEYPRGVVRGLVAFYPGCAAGLNDAGWKPSAPMLMLMGEADDWTPIAPCRRLASRFTPPALELVGYAGAYHDFDAPGGIRVMQNIPNSQNADKSVHAGTNASAQAAALVRVSAFLASLPSVR